MLRDEDVIRQYLGKERMPPCLRRSPGKQEAAMQQTSLLRTELIRDCYAATVWMRAADGPGGKATSPIHRMGTAYSTGTRWGVYSPLASHAIEHNINYL